MPDSKGALLAMAVAVGWGASFESGVLDAQVPDSGAWALRVLDRQSGTPLEGVLLAFPLLSQTRVTNSRGVAAGPTVDAQGEADDLQVRVLATRLGYAEVDTLLSLPEPATVVVLRMERAAVPLPPLTVATERSLTSRELQRLIFDREIAIGAVGMTQADIKSVPAVGEADVFRSLQAFAGVSSVNDYNGQLYTRGGDGDQVAVLLDGAPVFAPYHMFGLFGVFNPDAIESTEFYRGSIPARHGGVLSGVVSARHKTGNRQGTRFRGGVSLLGLRAQADGAAPWGEIRWMAAGRVASVDVARLDIPWSFKDVNVAVDAHPAEKHRVRFSLLGSSDDFAYAYAEKSDNSLASAWSNLVSSVSWSWVRDNHLTSNVTAFYSRYRGNIRAGDGDAGDVSASGISEVGLRANLVLRGEVTGGRAGIVVEGGPADLVGDGPGAYLHGDLSGSYMHLSAFAEAERWFGPLLVAPGIRVSTDLRASRTFVQPRFSLRYRARTLAVSLSVDRAYQFLSHLRDAHAYMPGAPMWFVHGRDQPASAANGASVAVDAWRGDEWTASTAVWARQFRDKPAWRPIRSRSPDLVEFHDGTARGVEAMLRKHGGRIRGWLSYQWAQTTFTDSDGEDYLPTWHRTHELDAVTTADVAGGLGASARIVVGSGTPFWFPLGEFGLMRYDPRTRIRFGRTTIYQLLASSGSVTAWSDVQGQLPTYARVDVSLRYSFRWGSWQITPFVSLVNAAGRQNVLFYFSPTGSTDQLPPFPFGGIDVEF